MDFPEGIAVTYGSTAALSREDSHHFTSVLRLEEGAEVTAIHRATGTEYSAIIASIDKHVATLRILAVRDTQKSVSPVSSLVFGLAKGKKCDFVCEKACELGVRNIILWQSARSIVRIESPRDAEKKLERWRKITETAAKQSGNDFIPQVFLALDTQSLLTTVASITAPGDRKFICALSPDSRLPSQIPDVSGNVHIAVGPEGDFTPEEERDLRAQGFEALSLGPLVLRCETAAIVAVSMVHGAWGFRARTAEQRL